jgi:hypothetical protein
VHSRWASVLMTTPVAGARAIDPHRGYRRPCSDLRLVATLGVHLCPNRTGPAGGDPAALSQRSATASPYAPTGLGRGRTPSGPQPTIGHRVRLCPDRTGPGEDTPRPSTDDRPPGPRLCPDRTGPAGGHVGGPPAMTGQRVSLCHSTGLGLGEDTSRPSGDGPGHPVKPMPLPDSPGGRRSRTALRGHERP